MTRSREAATRVVRALKDAGHTAYFAGGCVRDELLGLTPEDYDVATDATPDQVEDLFRKTKSVGKSFGVVLVRDGRLVTEVATFREESGYTDNRHPDEVRFADAHADARRRDFTINALFLDPLDTAERSGGRVIDFVGGVGDLDARILRAVGDPGARLAEDHLRALRAVRFTSRLGFTLEHATAEAIRAHACELEGVSRERVGDEVRRMLQHPNRATSARLMQMLSLDAPAIHDGALPDAPTDAIGALPPNSSVPLALCAWSVDRLAARGEQVTEERAGTIVARLRAALVLANEECDELGALLWGLVAFREHWEDAGTAQRKRWGGSDWRPGVLTVLGVRDAQLADRLRTDIETLENTPSGLTPPPLVTGEDLIAEGLKPGPMFGKWLYQAYDAQLEDRISTRQEAISLISAWHLRRGDGE